MEDTIDSNKKLLSNSKQIAESKLGTRTSAKTNHDLLRWLFKNNPDRLKALKSAMKKHGH